MLVTLVEPTREPVTLAEVKEHLRVDHDAHDARIARYISAAREALELATGRALAAGTYQWSDDGATRRLHRLPLWPVAAISAVEYRDAYGAPVVLAAPGDYWASLPQSAVHIYRPPAAGALSVTFTTAALPCPPALRAALYLLVTDLYELGGTVVAGTAVAINPTVDRLINPHRVNLGV